MDSRLRGNDEWCIGLRASGRGILETPRGFKMSEQFVVIAEEIDDDVLIRFPNEVGVREGQKFEIDRRSDGVVVLKFATPDRKK